MAAGHLLDREPAQSPWQEPVGGDERLPPEALAMIRYHSFYAAHREGAYGHLMDAHDRQMFSRVRAFNPYDLYSKSATRPDVRQLRPFYEELIAEYFPSELRW